MQDKRTIRWFGALLLTSLLLAAGPAPADDHRDIRRKVESGEIMSLQSILQAQPELAEARILEVELERKHGSFYYEIEFLNDRGRVDKVLVDAVSGKILRRKRDD